MINRLVLALFVFFAASAFAANFSCPAGQEDMLAYWIMAYPARQTSFMGPGNANPIYTIIAPDLGQLFASSGYFVWTKSRSGYPWDVKTFDKRFVYDRTTELNWNDPTSFKRFTADLPMSHRCVPIGQPGATIRIQPGGTQYSSYASCESYKTQNLNYAMNTLSAPKKVRNVGNMGTVVTRYFRYHYGCNSSYTNCTDKEVFSLGYGVGLYDWRHYRSQNGQWNMVQQSQINQYDAGTAVPYLPCANSYE